MTALIIAIYGAAVATLALAIAIGASFKAADAERDIQGISDEIWPPHPVLASDLRREDLAQ